MKLFGSTQRFEKYEYNSNANFCRWDPGKGTRTLGYPCGESHYFLMMDASIGLKGNMNLIGECPDLLPDGGDHFSFLLSKDVPGTDVNGTRRRKEDTQQEHSAPLVNSLTNRASCCLPLQSTVHFCNQQPVCPHQSNVNGPSAIILKNWDESQNQTNIT